MQNRGNGTAANAVKRFKGEPDEIGHLVRKPEALGRSTMTFTATSIR
jgi:hypothetical protein